MSSKVKQVLVLRTDCGMPTGKMVSQGAHGSVAFLTRALRDGKTFDDFDDAERTWIEGNFTKIALRVDSEDALYDVFYAATAAGLEAHLIVDEGLTVLNGTPTATCVAIGPDYTDRIDAITGKLELL